MLRKIVTLALLVYLSVGISAAHQYTLSFSHLVKIAVPAVAQSKDIVAVSAKIGVLATKQTLPGYGQPGDSFAPFWAAKKTIELEKDGEYFRSKVRIGVSETGLSPRMGSVMMSLTLTYADGEELTLRDEVVSVAGTTNTSDYKAYSQALSDELSAFQASEVYTDTEVSTVTLYIRGPLPF